MSPARTRKAVWIVSVAAGLALSGCAEPRTLHIFSEVQSDDDRMPRGASSSVIDGIDPASTRQLWTNDGITYFAAQSDEMANCLVVLENLEAVAACSPSLPIRMRSEGGPEMLLGNDLPDSSDNWVKVGEHLWTRPQ